MNFTMSETLRDADVAELCRSHRLDIAIDLEGVYATRSTGYFLLSSGTYSDWLSRLSGYY